MNRTRAFCLVVLLLGAALLAACGAGGGSGPIKDPPTGSSLWNDMVWNQDNWGE